MNERISEKEKLKVLLIEPDKYPKMIEIDDTLEAMQELVGGNIEEYMPFEDEVAIICNEEGKLMGLPLNRAIYDESNKEMIEIMAGRFFITYAPVESEKFLDLPKDLADKYSRKYHYPERFFKTDKGIQAIPFKPANKDRDR